MSLTNTKVLEALPAGVIILNARGLIKECNPAATALLGEPLIGERWSAVIERSFAPQADDGHEVSLKDGRLISVQTCSLENGPGQLILLSDLTETRALQSRVARNERLSMMGRMVASLAHQVRTPLSAAMLYASHLTKPDLPSEKQNLCARKLLDRLNHLEQHIQDLLIFARGDCPVAERVLASDLMQSVRNAAETIIQASDVNIEWDQRGGNPWVVCNRETLVGGILNLVNNARDALRGQADPQILVQFRTRETGELLIRVQDNGVGFDSRTAERLKEAFYTTKGQGTGLGLAVVEGITRAHGGEFTIESAGSGQGAVACIALPSVEAGALADNAETVPVRTNSFRISGGFAHV